MNDVAQTFDQPWEPSGDAELEELVKRILAIRARPQASPADRTSIDEEVCGLLAELVTKSRDDLDRWIARVSAVAEIYGWRCGLDAATQSRVTAALDRQSAAPPTKRSSVAEPVAEPEPPAEPDLPETAPTAACPKILRVPLASIVADPAAQPRVAGVDQGLVDEFATAMGNGDRFPPLVVFHDADGVCWLASGFHRHAALMKHQLGVVECVVHRGGLREAVLFSVGQNHDHGNRRSPADLRRAVMTLLADPEWGSWSDNRLAMRCHVSDKTIGKYRAEFASLLKSEVKTGPAASSECSEDRPRTVMRGGKTYVQKTGRIGKRAAAPTAVPDVVPHVVVPVSDPEPPSVNVERPIAGPEQAIDGGKLAVSAPPWSELGIFQYRIQQFLNDLHKEGRKRIEATNPRIVLDRTLLLERELIKGGVIPPNKRYEKWKATLPADAPRKAAKDTADEQATGKQMGEQLDLVTLAGNTDCAQ
jgi:hypothetical protein